MNRQLQKRFRNRILLYLLLSTLIPLCIWGSMVYTESLGVHRAFFEKQLQLSNEVVFIQTDRWRANNLAILNFLIREVRSAPKHRWNEILQNAILSDPGSYASMILNLDGFNVARSDSGPFQSYADRAYFKYASRGQTYSEPVVSKTYQKPAFCSAGPLFRDGEVKNVIVLCSFLDRLADTIGAIRIGTTGYVVLIDEKGRLLAHPQDSFLKAPEFAEESMALEKARLGPSGRIEFDGPEGSYIAYVSTLQNGWRVISLQSKNEIHHLARSSLKWVFAIGMLVLFSLSIITIYFVDRSTAPLHRLTKAVRELGHGNLEAKVEVQGRDEIGLLAFTFNRMATEIRRTIEELKEKEAQLERHRDELHQKVVDQSQKLLYSSKMSSLGEMAGGLAHEINNPLAIISMRAQKLQDGLESGKLKPQDALELAQQIETTCLRINKIVRGLRAFSRDGSHDPMIEENLSSILADTIDLCAESLRSKGIVLQVKCEPHLSLECQPVQISQVLLNLIMNARDAIQGEKDKWIRIECSDLMEHLLIRVTDSGHGIAPATRDQMMLPFFTTKGVGEGTGLGLSICKGIVEQHQGQIVYNPDAENTQFLVSLPKKQNRKKKPARPPESFYEQL